MILGRPAPSPGGTSRASPSPMNLGRPAPSPTPSVGKPPAPSPTVSRGKLAPSPSAASSKGDPPVDPESLLSPLQKQGLAIRKRWAAKILATSGGILDASHSKVNDFEAMEIGNLLKEFQVSFVTVLKSITLFLQKLTLVRHAPIHRSRGH